MAWRVFRWQGEKDHKAWIRDQRKAEWSAILGRLTAVDIKMPHVFSNVDWPKLTAGSLEELRNVLPIMRNVIFIAEELAKNELIAGYIDFVSEAAIKIKSIEDINTFYFQSSGLTNPDELAALNNVKIRKMKEREDVYGELYDEFHKQAEIIQKAARTALNLPDGSME